MATKTSSLLDDADFGNIGKGKDKDGRPTGEQDSGGTNTVKIALVVIGFLVGGAGLTYYYWPEAPVASSKPGGKGALSATEQEAAKKQEKQREEDMQKPDRVVGPS